MSSSLARLYVSRVAFSALWVTIVSSVHPATESGTTLSALAGVLLVLYPISDIVATVLDLRNDRAGATRLAQRVNLAAGATAAVAVATTALASLTTAMDAFAVWAIASGAIQVFVGLRRRGRLGGQWLMVVSGAGSIFAGTTFIGWSHSPAAALHVLVQYSIGGAVWYLLTALWLLRSGDPAPAAAAGRS